MDKRTSIAAANSAVYPNRKEMHKSIRIFVPSIKKADIKAQFIRVYNTDFLVMLRRKLYEYTKRGGGDENSQTFKDT